MNKKLYITSKPAIANCYLSTRLLAEWEEQWVTWYVEHLNRDWITAVISVAFNRRRY